MAIKSKKLFAQYKLKLIHAVAAVMIFLLIVNIYLSSRVYSVEHKNERNVSQLNTVVSGFSVSTLEQMRKDVTHMKAQIMSLSSLFDPRDRAGSVNYDLNVRFVEELDNASKEIQVKAESQGTAAVDLGFREKLTSQKDQAYVINQLISLKNLVLKGMDAGISFNAIVPQNIEKTSVGGIRLAKSRIELSCPAQALGDFVVQLDSLTPALCIDTCTIAMRDGFADITLTVSNIIVDLAWMQKKENYDQADVKNLVPLSSEDLSKAIRGKNIFSLSEAESDNQTKAASRAVPEKVDDAARFFYRGKAMLRGKDVVVVEDTQKKETVFIAQGGIIADYKLIKFNNQEMVLQNIKDGKELNIAKSPTH